MRIPIMMPVSRTQTLPNRLSNRPPRDRWGNLSVVPKLDFFDGSLPRKSQVLSQFLVLLCFITTYGTDQDRHSSIVHSEVTMDDLSR